MSETPTSNPGCWSYDNIYVGLICMFISPLCLNRTIDGGRYGISRMRIRSRAIRSGKNGQGRCRSRRSGHPTELSKISESGG